MRAATFVLAAVVGLAASSPAFAGNILWFEDGTLGTSAVGGAIALTPHSYQFTNNATTFNSMLNSGTWDLVIWGEENNAQWATCSAALTSYVNGGGKVIGATWQNTGFAAMMQGSLSSTNVTSITTTSHAIFANCGASIGISNPGYGIYSQCYSPTSTASGLGTSGAAYGVILGNGGRTLLNAPLFSCYTSLTTGQQFIANEINFLITHPINGRILFDRYVTDATGIGNSSELGLPLSGMTIVELNSTGAIVGTGVTDAAGNFTVGGSQITNGSLAVLSGGTACNVRKTAGGALYQAVFLTGADFTVASPINVGTITLGEALDPGGVNRAPINIARTIQTVYDWAHQRAPTKTIQLVDPVLYDAASSLPSSYTAKNGATLASMRVASAASGNPDAWDVSVIRKNYGRHILGAIAADPGTTYDNTFDKATDDYNAFAEGFGYYMNAVVSRDTKYFDGINPSTTNVLDMENPPLTTPKGTNVAGWNAAALYDLVDPANEPWDTFDGTGTAGEQVFNAVATLSAPVSSTTFFGAWIAKGYDGTALARDLIHHGTLSDDADEPNDFISEATPISQFGFVRTNRVLQQFNDDYYRFTLSYPTNVLTVDMVYDRSRYTTQSVLVELLNTSGGVVATGSPVGVGGPIEAKSGALPAADYIVHVKLLSGGSILQYTLQCYSQLAFTSGSFPEWTVGRPINVPVNMTGGIPPYNLTVLSPFVKPDGLVLDGVNARVAGTPTGPQTQKIPVGGSYTYNFILSAQDAASPTPNTASGPVTFKINDMVRAHFGPFAAFPFGKPVDAPAPFTGGTAPYTTTVTSGSLPHGLSATGGAKLRITGTPDSPGSYSFTMAGTDIALSADTASCVGVACVPLGTAALAPGTSACGFYFDVVKGSTVALSVTTAKKGAKRALSGTLLDKDGFTVLVPAAAKTGKGKTKSPVFVAPSTGRFYFVVSSADAGGATNLNATAKIVADKSGKGDNGVDQFVSPDTAPVQIGALAGATITLTAKPDGAGLALRGMYMIDPTGAIVLFGASDVLEKADGSILVKKTVASSGTWTFVVGAKPGPQGHFTYTYKVAEPAKVVFSAD